MQMRGAWAKAAILAATVALVAGAVAAGAGADSSGSKNAQDNVLRIGWAQNPSTINPFVGLDEEAYTIWAMNWDLLVNFSPKDLSPAPGIARSWKVSDGGKTVTF